MNEEPTRLPVLLVHGIAVRDAGVKHSTLWGRIPAGLRAQGNDVWFGNQDSWGDIDSSAEQLACTIREMLATTGADKIHVIAHSKGGIDAKRAIHLPGIPEHIASSVTLSSPHQGLRMCSLIDTTRVIPLVAAPFVDAHARHMGDINPNSARVVHQLSSAGAKRIALENPDLPGVEYRSYGFVTSGVQFRKMGMPSHIIRLFDGENDGIVPLYSTRSTNWSLITAHEDMTFDHNDVYDLAEDDIDLTLPDGRTFDNSSEFVCWLVRDLDRIAAERAAHNGPESAVRHADKVSVLMNRRKAGAVHGTSSKGTPTKAV